MYLMLYKMRLIWHSALHIEMQRPDGLRHISCDLVVPPVSCGETKTEQTSSTTKSNCKTNLGKADKPSSLSQPSPSLKALQTPSPLLNCQGRNPTASWQLLPCICIPEPPALAAPQELFFSATPCILQPPPILHLPTDSGLCYRPTTQVNSWCL